MIEKVGQQKYYCKKQMSNNVDNNYIKDSRCDMKVSVYYRKFYPFIQ